MILLATILPLPFKRDRYLLTFLSNFEEMTMKSSFTTVFLLCLVLLTVTSSPRNIKDYFKEKARRECECPSITDALCSNTAQCRELSKDCHCFAEVFDCVSTYDVDLQTHIDKCQSAA
ncbi:uncharacterized protein [Montipora capricornis]|uniref:uncharacterized protein n=1 Tax=Montipora capricornis TaxID=246305 RepID=UPI0035F166D4